MTPILGAAILTSNPSNLLEWVKALAPIIAAVIAAVGVCLTIWVALRKGRDDARYNYAAKALDLRLRQLSDFYAPLRLDIEQSRILYKKLLWSLERIKKSNTDVRFELDGFRLLDHVYTILHDDSFAEVRPLVQSILAIGDRMSGTMLKHAGLAEGGISATLIEYRAHLEMLKVAANQAPKPGEDAGWQQFGYYPRMLNREVIEGYKEVLRRFEVFQEAGDKIVWSLLGRLPEERRREFHELLDNLTYYERNVEAYAARFDLFDLSGLRSSLEQSVRLRVAKGLSQSSEQTEALALLDAGCGTGRDCEAFIRSGFRVTAFDISPAMVRKCNRRIRALKTSASNAEAGRASQSSCEEMSFDEVRYRNEFDAVWAAASLLHVPKCDFPAILQRLMQALKPHGVMFISLKYGVGEAEFDSRYYSYFRRRELVRILRHVPHAKLLETWLTDSRGKRLSGYESLRASLRLTFGGTTEGWVNILVTKVFV